MTLHKLMIAAMWAGVISLDFTACGPFMVSQPLVCGPVFGWLVGQTAVGVIIGGIVQLLWMDLSPIGVSIPYDATATTILAVYWANLPVLHAGVTGTVLYPKWSWRSFWRFRLDFFFAGLITWRVA